MRVRDALYEAVDSEDYTGSFAELKQMANFTGYPVVVGIDGNYGTGKTRMLKGLRECAKEECHPTTWFNTSDYDPDDVDLLRVLLTQMGSTYLEQVPHKLYRANFFGAVAGSIDTGLAFCGKKGGILAARKAYHDALEAEREELLGPWTNYSDSVQLYKDQFADLAQKVCKAAASEEKEEKLWFVFLDDLDRLFPLDALKLILSLRGIIGGPPDIDNAQRPMVVFVIALNMDCLRAAIKQRYKETYADADEKIDAFVEHYLRKLFLMGPAVPKLQTEDVFGSHYSIEDNIEPLIDRNLLEKLIALCEEADLPQRPVLLALDRMQLQLLKAQDSSDSFDVSTEVASCVFCYELARILHQPIFASYIHSERDMFTLDSYIGHFRNLEKLGDFCSKLHAVSEEIDLKNVSSWERGRNVCNA